MVSLYFVPDSDSCLLSDHSPDGSVFFGGGRELPEDIHWRCLCHLCCRYLSRGMDWPDVLDRLEVEDGSELSQYFLSYTGMTPRSYGEWCRARREI